MSFSRKTILTTLFAITLVASTLEPVNACGGRRRSSGSSRSYSSHRSYSTPSHSYGYSSHVPSYSTPTYSYSRPVAYHQPVQQYHQAPAPVVRVQAVSQSQPIQGQQPAVRQIGVQQSVQQQLAPQQPVQQQLAPQQPVQRQLAPQQPVQRQLAPQQPVQRQLAPQQPVQQQLTPQQPVQQQLAPQQPAPQQLAPQNAAQSALQALGGFAPPASTQVVPASKAAVQPHVGNWTAAVGTGSSVTLTLQNDGRFRWVATNKSGQSSSFDGTYTVANGSLSLQRSNDSQQLAGSMSVNGTNAFSFKVAGNNAAALNFQRS